MIFYWLYNKKTKLTKFGITENLEQRVNQLENQSGCNLDIIAQYDCEHAQSIEIFIHSTYKAYRQRGEWFALSDKEVSMLFTLLDTYFDSFKELKGNTLNPTDKWIFEYSGFFDSSKYFESYKEKQFSKIKLAS